MDTLMEILEDVQPDVDFESCDTLIDDGMLDSLQFFPLSVSWRTSLKFPSVRQTLFRKTLTQHRHFGLWYRDCRLNKRTNGDTRMTKSTMLTRENA